MIHRFRTRLRNADADLNEILRGSAIAFVVKILAAGSAFALNVVIARQLGASEAGLFFLAYTVILIASADSRLGLDNTFVRFFAAYHASNEWGPINGLYRMGVLWSLTASIIAASGLWLFAHPLANLVFAKPAFADVIRVMAFSIPLMALSALHAKALQGIKRIPHSMTVLSVSAPIAVLCLALIVWPRTATSAGWLVVVGSGLTLTLGVYWWRRLSHCYAPADTVNRREILVSCIPLLGVLFLSQVVNWSSQIMLGAWASSADVAVFSAAQRTAMLAVFVLAAVNSIAAPKFAAMHRTKQPELLRRSATHATRLVLVLALLPLSVMLLFPNALLMVFGPEFTAGAGALRILAIGQFINVTAGSVGFLLSMTGYEKLLRNNALAAALTTLGLGLYLIPVHGITGAAIATSSGVAVQNILGVWQVRRVHGFTTLAIWRK